MGPKKGNEDNHEESSDNSQDDELDFTFLDITIPRADIKENGVVCPFCKQLQKRINGHIKIKHKGRLGSGHKAFATKLTKYMAARRHQKYKKRTRSCKVQIKSQKGKTKIKTEVKKRKPQKGEGK